MKIGILCHSNKVKGIMNGSFLAGTGLILLVAKTLRICGLSGDRILQTNSL